MGIQKNNGNRNGNGDGHGDPTEEQLRAAENLDRALGGAPRPEPGADALDEGGVALAFQSPLDPNGYAQLTDLMQLQVLCAFIVQKMGKASQQDVEEKLESIKAKVSTHLLHQALEGLRGRSIISYASGRKPQGSVAVYYKMRRAEFAPSLEMAHITDLLPRLVATPEAKSLMAELNGEEADVEEDEKKKQRELGYQDYIAVKVTLLTLDELVGSQPASPWLDDLCKRSQKLAGLPKVDAQLRFWRDYTTGLIKLPSDALRGWIRTGLRSAGFSDAVAGYIAVSDALVLCDPKQLKSERKLLGERFADVELSDGKPEQIALPVIDPKTREGKGLSTCEVLPPKQLINIVFRIPTKGFMSAKQFKMWLAAYAPNPIRGFSPARGARFGKAVMIRFEDLGPISNAANALNSVLHLVPDEAKAFYAALLAEAHNLDLRKGKDASAS